MKFKIGGFTKPDQGSSTGLDIGSKTIKSVKLRFTKEGAELESFALQDIAGELQTSLSEFSRAHNIRPANISLSGPSTLIRYVNFPKMDAVELRQALKFEAQKHIPFPVADVNLDGYILEPELADNKMMVLLAVVKKDMVAQRLRIIEEAGIRAASINIDSVALINAYNYSNPVEADAAHKAAAIVNIGAAITNLNIVEKGIPRLSRDIHIGGAAFTRKLSEVLALDFDAAEKMKIDPDEQNRGKINAVMESMITNLCLEIRTSFDFYESQSAVSVGKIYISGGSCCFQGLQEMVAASVGVPVDVWDPFKKITLAKDVDAEALHKHSSRLAVAAGLALKP